MINDPQREAAELRSADTGGGCPHIAYSLMHQFCYALPAHACYRYPRPGIFS